MPIRSFIPCSLSHLKCSRERFETEKLPEGRVFRAEGDRSGDGDVERERERIGAGGSWGRKLEVHLHTWQTREGKKDFEMVSRFFIRSFVKNVLTIEKNRNRLS